MEIIHNVRRYNFHYQQCQLFQYNILSYDKVQKK